MKSRTDGRSPTGHDRKAAIRSLAASSRVHPASWEIAIRLQLGSIARYAWVQGRGLEPLVSFSDGRTFRIIVRIHRNIGFDQEHQLGFLGRCGSCGAQFSQSLINLKDWDICLCKKGSGHLLINGPLWLGPLQSPSLLNSLQGLAKKLPVPFGKRTEKLLALLQADPGVPGFSWSTAELASRVSLLQTPKLPSLINALQVEGFQAFYNGLIPGHLRTDATIEELLRVFKEISY